MTVPDPIRTPGKAQVVLDMYGAVLGRFTAENAAFVQVGSGLDARYHRKENVWIVDEDQLPNEAQHVALVVPDEGLVMRSFRVKVLRKTYAWETGYLTVEAPDEDAALEVAYGMDDPSYMETGETGVEHLEHTIV